ncbi:MAG: hypothetical protein MUP90_01685 [Gammaproteobacteria bacterium]|nr:hypothetical protein [Gammaproteobacteria bacterium]
MLIGLLPEYPGCVSLLPERPTPVISQTASSRDNLQGYQSKLRTQRDFGVSSPMVAMQHPIDYLLATKFPSLIRGRDILT